MILSNHKQLDKFLQQSPEIAKRLVISDKDTIGFMAVITTKTGKKTKPLRFDFSFNSEAFECFIDENPDQLKPEDLAYLEKQ